MGCPLERHAARQAEKAGFRRAIGAMHGIADIGGSGGEVHDAAPTTLDHARKTELDGPIGAGQVHVQHAVPELVGMVDHEFAHG